MLRDAWIKHCYGPHATFETTSSVPGMGLTVELKLTLSHFLLDGFLAMRVGRAVQILSNTMARICRNVTEQGLLPQVRLIELERLCLLTNRSIDIMNSWKGVGKPGAPKSSDEMCK